MAGWLEQAKEGLKNRKANKVSPSTPKIKKPTTGDSNSGSWISQAKEGLGRKVVKDYIGAEARRELDFSTSSKANTNAANKTLPSFLNDFGKSKYKVKFSSDAVKLTGSEMTRAYNNADKYTLKELKDKIFDYETAYKSVESDVGAVIPQTEIERKKYEQEKSSKLKKIKSDIRIYKKAYDLKYEGQQKAASAHYKSVPDKKDFEEKSRIEYNNKPESGDSIMYKSEGYSKAIRELYENSDGFGEKFDESKKIFEKYGAGDEFNGGVIGEGAYKTAFYTEQEKAVYRYLKNTEGKKSAKAYLDYIDEKVNARAATEHQKITEKVAKERPVYASLSTAVSPAVRGTLGAIGTVKAKVENSRSGTDDPIDINSIWFSGIGRRNTTVDTVSKDMNYVENLLYQTGMSMGEMAAALPFGPNGSLVIMGSNAMAQTAYEATERGATADEALTLGLASAATEIITEKIGIDNLFKAAKMPISGGKKFLKELFKQSGIEATEELVAEIVNTIADYKIMGEKSQFSVTTRESSNADAIKQVVGSAVTSALGGWLSGLVFGGANVTFGSIRSNIVGRNINKANLGNELVELNLSNNETSGDSELDVERNELVKELSAKIKNGETPTNMEIGALYIASGAKTQNAISTHAVEILNKAHGQTENIANATFKQSDKTTDSTETADVSKTNNDEVTDNVSNTSIPETANLHSVKVGDIFKNTKYGYTVRVVSRDESNTVLETDNGTKTEQRAYANAQADTLITNNNFEQIESNTFEIEEQKEEYTFKRDSELYGIANAEEVLKTEQNNDKIIKNDMEGIDYGTDGFGKTTENDKRHSQSQNIENTSEEVSERSDKRFDRRSSRERLFSRRNRKVETRTLDELCDTDDFGSFSKKIADEMSLPLIKAVSKNYEADERCDIYDFSEFVAYDMIADTGNPLRERFADEIAEYFNDDKTSTNKDSTGNPVDEAILNRTRSSIVKNENGQLIPVYHSTDKVFDDFIPGDIGIHFGSYSQALQRAEDKNNANPIVIEAYLNITNPLVVDTDFWGWNALQIVQELNKLGVIDGADAVSFARDTQSSTDIKNQKLVDMLKQKGYDGIIYTNAIEAVSGKSYIAFDNEQIFIVDDIPENNNPSEIITLEHTDLYSIFKDSEKIIIGLDVITDGKVAVPKTDESLSKIKSIVKCPITENKDIALDMLYHKDNDVIISGNPKVFENKEYIFTINGEFYACQQKYINAFNNGDNVITAGKTELIPWTVHNSNGDLIGIIMPTSVSSNFTTAMYNNLQSAREVLQSQTVNEKTAEVANKQEDVENEADVLKTDTESDKIKQRVSYSIDDDNSQTDVMWTIEEGLLTKKDIALFYSEIAKLNYRNSNNYHISSFGDYILDIENKLIYTDGNYEHPTITKVISFKTEFENDMLYAKELIFSEERTQSSLNNAFQVIEEFYGQGFVSERNIENSRAYERENRGTEGSNSREFNQESEPNVSYSIDNDDGQIDVMWTIEEGVLTRNEVAAFYDKISEMVNNKYSNFKLSKDGYIIFEITNKLIYTDGDYDFPCILKVVTFNTNNGDLIEFGRESVYDGEEQGFDLEDALEISEIVYGEKFTTIASFEDSRAYERENRETERNNSRGFNQESEPNISYSIDNSSESEILELLDDFKRRRGVKYNNGSAIRIPNSDMEVLRHTFKTEEHYSNRTEGLLDCISCSGNKGKTHYFYVFYKGEDGRVLPVFRLNYSYIDRYVDVIRDVIKEMGYEFDEIITKSEEIDTGLDTIRDARGRNSVDVVNSANGRKADGISGLYTGTSGQGERSEQKFNSPVSDGLDERISNTKSETNDVKIDYSIDNEHGVSWAIQNHILTDSELSKFLGSIGAKERGLWFPETLFGEYIFEIYDKLIYTDGDYVSPSITKIIIFEGLTSEEIEYGKELIWNAEKRGKSSKECIEIIKLVLGHGTITERDPYDSGANRKSQNNSGKRKNGKRTNSKSETDVDYSFESEGQENEQNRDLLSDGSGERKNSSSARQSAKRVDRRTSRYRERRKTARGRREFCKALKADGNTEQKIVFGHRCEVIPVEHYDARMRRIEKRNIKNGIDETIFITGGAEIPFIKNEYGNPKTAKGVFIDSDGRKVIIVQYDNEFSMPEQINDHELVHKDYDTERVQKVKNIILNNLSGSEINSILDRISDDYSKIVKGNEEKIIEEFIANTLSGMNEYSVQFNNLVNAYWSGNDSLIDSFKTSEYVDIIDSGGNNSYREYRQLQEYIMAINHNGQKLKPVDCKEIGENFYVWKNKSKINYEVVFSVSIVGNENEISYMRGEINELNRGKKRLLDIFEALDERYGDGDRGGSFDENIRAGETNVSVYEEQSTSDRRGNFGEGSGDPSEDMIFKRGEVDIIDAGGEKTQRLVSEWNNNGIVLDAKHYAKAVEAIGTDYFSPIKNHEGIQYQSCVTDNEHFYVFYYDKGYGEYKFIGICGCEDSIFVDEFIRRIDDGEIVRHTEVVDRYVETDKFGQGGYIVYNAYTKKRGSSRGNGIVFKRESESNAGGFDTGSDRVSKIERNLVEDFDSTQGELENDNNTVINSDNLDIRYSLDDDGMYDLIDVWKEKIDEYGTIPKGETPARDIDVPKKISKGKVVSRFARTMLEAGVTPDFAVSEFEERILDGTMTHEVVTNKKASEDAKKKIKTDGYAEALRDWETYVHDNTIGKGQLALGMELYNQAITNKDVHTAMKIAAELVSEATRAGQTLQACRMLKLMSPDGQLYYLEKSVQKMNDEFRKKIGKKYKDIKLDEALMEAFLTETDEEVRNAVYDKICQDIADQIPSTLRDKWDSWRYLAMLGNPRTHFRNIIGNAVFVPAIRMKNYIGAVIENTAKVRTEDKTKSMKKTKAAVDFAKKDFEKMIKVLQGENAKYAVTSDIEGKRTIFKIKLLEKLRTKNFDFLEKEDMWFLKLHYVDALARIITARKVDVDSINSKTLDTLRAYAVKEAQAATYRDANALADALNQVQRKAERSDYKAVRAGGVLLEGLMPFKKTPLNIAKQGVNYSPVGIMTGVYKTLKKLKDGKAYNTTDIIDDLSKGLTGTGIMLLGLFLASIGALVGAEDENKKKREFDKMTGEQSYALKVGKNSYTIDWATPLSLPLFTGAELYKFTSDSDFTVGQVIDAISTLPEPLLELSVFSGISDAIESAQYSESNVLFAILSDMAISYVTQAFPTVGGQLSRIIDDNKREYYYTDKNSVLPKGIQSFIGQASSKIPFASYLFEPSVDEWGREETYGNVFERTLENLMSPGYYSKDSYTEVDKEIKRLYEETGDNSVLPTVQQKYYAKDKVYYYMSATDYTEVKKLRGKRSFELINNLIKSNEYRQMSDEDKIKAIKKCYETAGKETKEKMFEKVKNR